MATAIAVFCVAWAIILYTYIIFPILLAFFAKHFGKSYVVTPVAEDDLPRVAMVVAAYNEEHVIQEKLSNSWAIDYPSDRFTVWIGSDGSSDTTNTILQDCKDKRLFAHLFTERRGKISVLNDLFDKVNADIIIMSDANTMYSPDAVRRLVAHFNDPKVGCVSGELSLTQDGGVSGEGIYWKYEGWIKRNESRLGFLIGCNGGIFALRRQCFEPLPPTTIVEDFVLTMRILEKGYIVRFDPEAKATEPACASSEDEMRRKIRIGAGDYQALGLTWRVLLPQYGFAAFAFWGHKVLRWFVPFFLLVGLIANVVLVTQPLFAIILALQGAGLLVALFALLSGSNAKLPRWTRPVSYFYLMNYALLRGFFRFLLRKQRVTWDRAVISAVEQHKPVQPIQDSEVA